MTRRLRGLEGTRARVCSFADVLQPQVTPPPAVQAAAPLAAAGAGGGGPACAPLNVQPSQSAPASNDTSAMPSEGQAAHSGGGPGTPPLEEGPAKPQPQPIAIVPPVEAERLEALRALQLLGAPPQARFETITKSVGLREVEGPVQGAARCRVVRRQRRRPACRRAGRPLQHAQQQHTQLPPHKHHAPPCPCSLVQRIFGVAMVAVALIDERMHLLAKMGPLQCDGTRVGSFCDWALASDTPTMVVIEDTREDARFRDFPHVQMEGGVRFYAGAPLVSSHGGRKYGAAARAGGRRKRRAGGSAACLRAPAATSRAHVCHPAPSRPLRQARCA